MRSIIRHALLCTFALFPLVAWGAAESVEPANLPKAVSASIHARFPGAAITSAEKEVENNQMIYDIELKHENRNYEMDIKEDGTVIEIEKEIALANVPPAVRNAIESKFPQAKIKQVMEVNKVKGSEEKADHYEVTIQTGEKTELELMASLDGKSIEQEKTEEPAK